MNVAFSMPHLIAAPVLLPLAAAALVLALGERRRAARLVVSLAALALNLAVTIALLLWVDGQDAPGAFGVYLPGNWPVPFGIVLVADRLSALMLVLSAITGLGALLYGLARWSRAGVHFYPLLLLQVMGLNGAFLTADLFNLFVFFEVMLAASYGLLLHGGGGARVRAGLHYVTINLLASLLFLIGVALLYGVTGTLNMADIARKLPLVPESDRGLLHAGAAMLGMAFLVKAAIWPLNSWLPSAYAAASTPVAALFALLTKVGVYALLRLWTLCFPADAAASASFGSDALIWGGMATIAFGAIGMLASQHLGRLAGFGVITSAGTLVASIAFDQPALTAGSLYYLASSVLAGAGLFLLVELIDRSRDVEADSPLAVDMERHLPGFADPRLPDDVNLDDDAVPLIGRPFPATLAFLGLAFTVCALVVAGLPPLSGFVGKLAMLSALLQRPENEALSPAAGALFALLIASGLLAAIGLIRVGIRHFWSGVGRRAPAMQLTEGLPLALLLGGCLLLVGAAEPALRYMRATADALHAPERYIAAVTRAQPVAREARP